MKISLINSSGMSIELFLGLWTYKYGLFGHNVWGQLFAPKNQNRPSSIILIDSNPNLGKSPRIKIQKRKSPRAQRIIL